MGMPLPHNAMQNKRSPVALGNKDVNSSSLKKAMAVGRAVITTNVPGCRDTVIDQVNGYLIDVQNVSQLADAMSKFIADPSRIIVMGQESRKMAELRFDVRRINSQIIQLLHGAGH